jgi:hypothetical protein
MRELSAFAAGVAAALFLVALIDEGGRLEYPTAAEWQQEIAQ